MARPDRRERGRRERASRRAFLGTLGVAGGLGLSGCSSNPAGDPAALVVDPYADINWATVERHRCEFHNHVRGGVDEPADVADLYRDRGYTVYAVADKGERPMAWPWTAFSSPRFRLRARPRTKTSRCGIGC